MYLTLALGFVASVSAHSELSTLYKQYKAGKASTPLEKTHFRDVHMASKEDMLKYDASPFFPPHAGQSANDYHPVLRKPLADDEPMTYYSW